MANLSEEEREALRAIDCIGSTESDVQKALTLMGFIYAVAAYLFIRSM